MKSARIVTSLGGVLLAVTGCLHGSGYTKVMAGLAKQSIDPVTAGILKAGWFTFSGEMAALGIIALLASARERGGAIVLVCAAATIANALVVLHFLGPFVGVYVSGVVGALLLIGGYLQIMAAKTV